MAARAGLVVADHHHPEGGDGDPAIFMWFLRWVPFALEHGHDLLVTHHLNYPDGVNLMWNTSLPLPGLLLAPVTEAWGPVLSFNLLLVLAYGLSAWCAYLAIRRFAPGTWPRRSAGWSTASRRRCGSSRTTRTCRWPSWSR